MPTDLRLHRERLERRRKLAGYTVPALARELGIHQDSLYKIEYGVRRPSPQLYVQIKEALGVTGEELLDAPEGQCPDAVSATDAAPSPRSATTPTTPKSRARRSPRPAPPARDTAPSATEVSPDEGGAA